MRVSASQRQNATLTKDRDPRVAFLALRHWRRLELGALEEVGRVIMKLPVDAVEWPCVDEILTAQENSQFSSTNLKHCITVRLRLVC